MSRVIKRRAIAQLFATFKMRPPDDETIEKLFYKFLGERYNATGTVFKTHKMVTEIFGLSIDH